VVGLEGQKRRVEQSKKSESLGEGKYTPIGYEGLNLNLSLYVWFR
jgi:hypothetical protein